MKSIPLILAIVVAIAASGFAWQRNQALDEARAALSGANTQLQKAQADLKSVTAEVAPLRKEAADQKATIDQLQAELSSARAFLEAERAATARIRDELTLTKEKMAFMDRSRAAPSAQPGLGYPAPTMIRPSAPPMVIRAVPSTGNTVGAPAPGRRPE
jgi:peptidoglycan hydrolase CwlO-like protein